MMSSIYSLVSWLHCFMGISRKLLIYTSSSFTLLIQPNIESLAIPTDFRFMDKEIFFCARDSDFHDNDDISLFLMKKVILTLTKFLYYIQFCFIGSYHFNQSRKFKIVYTDRDVISDIFVFRTLFYNILKIC